MALPLYGEAERLHEGAEESDCDAEGYRDVWVVCVECERHGRSNLVQSRLQLQVGLPFPEPCIFEALPPTWLLGVPDVAAPSRRRHAQSQPATRTVRRAASVFRCIVARGVPEWT